jgi:tetratricopeptide (TPR) repeat protein
MSGYIASASPRNRLPALVIAAIACFAAQVSGAETDALGQLQERIEIAYRNGDLAALGAARTELQGLARDHRDEVPRYFAAYARFRQALAAADDSAAARGYVEDCISELRELVTDSPGNAEAHALLGSCYGISTRYNRLGMANRGLAARRELAAARELAPDSPWVILQDGLADFSTPAIFGGDRELGIAKVQRAAQLFEAAATEGSRMAAWAEAEAWSQLAAMYRAAGEPAAAATAETRARSALPVAGAPATVLAAL